MFVVNLQSYELLDNIFKGEITDQEEIGLQNIITDCWQLAYLEACSLPEKLRIMSQLMVNKLLYNNPDFEQKDIDNIAYLIGQLDDEEIIEIVQKVEPKKPEEFMYRFCYKHEELDDIKKAIKITATFVIRWDQLPDEVQDQITLLS